MSLASIPTLPRSEASVSGRVPLSATMPSLSFSDRAPGWTLASPLNSSCVPAPVTVTLSPSTRYWVSASPLPCAT